MPFPLPLSITEVISVFSAVGGAVAGGLGVFFVTKQSAAPVSTQPAAPETSFPIKEVGKELKNVLAAIREYLGETNIRTDRLVAVNDNIGDNIGADEIHAIIETLIVENRQLIKLSEDLQGRLEESQSKIDDLTASLDQAREEIQRDALTHLYGRKYFEEVFPKKVAFAKAAHQDLCLLLIDIDNFKQINDTYGHRAGDEVIRQMGALIASSIRKDDIAVRYGGDEFAIILPKAATDDAKAIAERIQALLRIKHWTFDKAHARGLVTTSIGVSALSWRDSAEMLFKRADAFLYNAKGRGKNYIASR